MIQKYLPFVSLHKFCADWKCADIPLCHMMLFSSSSTNEGTYASVKSLLSRDYMHHVDLSETRKSPKG